MSLDGNTILFVDDEKSILQTIARVLRGEGYRMFFATSADEALKILERERVDLVCSDYLMPQMNGLELSKLVRDRFPGVAFCVLSGNANLDVALTALNKGHVQRLILKPWNDLELKVTLRELLNQSRSTERHPYIDEIIESQVHKAKALEVVHPEITDVERDEDGAIVLDEEDLNTAVNSS